MADLASMPTKLRWFVALFALISGALPMLAALDVGPLSRDDINGPPWLGFVAGGIFFLLGLTLLAPRQRALRVLLPVATGGGLAAIGNWIAFGAGMRECTGSISGYSYDSGDLGCRIAFGYGALMLDSMLIWGTGALLVRRYGPRLLPSGIEKLGKGLFFLTIAPLLLLLLLMAVGKGFADGFHVWRKTGRWPRNEAFIARMKMRREKPPPEPPARRG